MATPEWKTHEDDGLKAYQLARRSKIPMETCKYLRITIGHMSKAYQLADGVPTRLNKASLCARSNYELAGVTREQCGAQEEIEQSYREAVRYFDLALNEAMREDLEPEQIEPLCKIYTTCLKEALKFALSMGQTGHPKQGVWFIESVMANIKKNDHYPHMTFQCALHVARIWENQAHQLLDDGDCAKAMGMLREAKSAIEEVERHSIGLKDDLIIDMNKVKSKVDNYFIVAKSMQTLDKAECLQKGLSGKHNKKTREIAHEVIDLYRSAISLAQDKHSSTQRRSLEGIGTVYRDILNDHVQAQKYFDEASKTGVL